MNNSTCFFHHHHNLIHHSPNYQHDNNNFKLHSLKHFNNNSSLKFRFQTQTKSSSKQNPTTSSPLQEPQLDSKNDDISETDSPTSSNPFVLFIQGFREKVKVDELGLEIIAIALPAALALAADPITSLVDTAFVGHLGSAELAAVGVSISIFNLVAKLFNIPLLNITTSFVAEEQAVLVKGDDGSTSGFTNASTS